jgi:hypothetical protein
MEAAFNARISGKGKRKCNTAKFLWPKPFKTGKEYHDAGKKSARLSQTGNDITKSSRIGKQKSKTAEHTF